VKTYLEACTTDAERAELELVDRPGYTASMETTMIDTLALATEALNAEGAWRYFDATEDELAAFLSANTTLWTVGDTFNPLNDDPENPDAFNKALMGHLDSLGRIEQALEGLQAVHNDDMETMIIGNLAQHNCVAEVYDRSESDPSIRLFIDLGWPLNGDLIVTMRYDGYGTDSGAFVIDDWYTR